VICGGRGEYGRPYGVAPAGAESGWDGAGVGVWGAAGEGAREGDGEDWKAPGVLGLDVVRKRASRNSLGVARASSEEEEGGAERRGSERANGLLEDMVRRCGRLGGVDGSTVTGREEGSDDHEVSLTVGTRQYSTFLATLCCKRVPKNEERNVSDWCATTEIPVSHGQKQGQWE
jgi:hypothetical protein